MPLTISIIRGRLLALAAIALFCSLFCGCSSGGGKTLPHAKQGVIDLTSWDFSKDGSVDLNGEWEFYWQQLLAPDDFHAGNPPAVAYLTLPAAWNGARLKGEKLRGEGFATFRLRILPGAVNRELSLHLDVVHSAYRIWSNGKLLVESGVVGKDVQEEIPNHIIRRIRLNVENQPVELVLQISNHHYREGGAVSSLAIGATDELEAAQQMKWGISLFCIGSLAVMGVYHLALFCFRRKNPAPLYFGIFCLLWTGYFFTSKTNGWVASLFFEHIPGLLINRIDMICYVISVPVIYCFFRTLYPEEFSLRLQQISLVQASLFTVLGLATPTMIFTSLIPAYYAFSLLLILYSLAMLFKAMRAGREGVSFILLGFIVIGIAGTNDMLYDLQLIRSEYIFRVGMLVFILFQAVALSLRFSRAFSEVELLTDELSNKNQALKEDLAERIRLEHEIVRISDNERLKISHELHDGLCQQLTGARLRCAALENRLVVAGVDGTEVRPLGLLLEEAVNHAYNLSRGLWPLEHDSKGVTHPLEELVRRTKEQSGIDTVLNRKQGCAACGNEQLTQMYRIIREAVANAVKHSGASLITVSLECSVEGGIFMAVSDNGCGRDTPSIAGGGMGIAIMSHRAKIIGGHLKICDEEGGGTAVSCTAPCSGQSPLEEHHVKK